jgi:osmotically-inducible protein OsmY
MRITALVLLLGLAAGGILPGCAGTAGAPAAKDRRAAGVAQQDEEIELKAGGRLTERRFEGVHAHFTAFNRRLLITGEAPTDAVKGQVADLVHDLPDVREIANELVVAPPAGQAARNDDGYLTARIKTRLVDDKRFSPNHLKVVTENGVAYLIGLVKREEGKAAAEVAARTPGVRRVVKEFEYLD